MTKDEISILKQDWKEVIRGLKDSLMVFSQPDQPPFRSSGNFKWYSLNHVHQILPVIKISRSQVHRCQK